MPSGILEYTGSGILLGLTAGISPGPLLTLVIAQTLEHNRKEGFKVAVAPLITDIPIVLLTLLVFSRIQAFDVVAGIISLLGAGFITWLAWDTFKNAAQPKQFASSDAKSYQKGILVNFLSPHPYLFWMLVGAPMVANAAEESHGAATGFIAGFYILLVGSKMIIALLADKSKRFLKSGYYKGLLYFLGIALLFFSVKLFIDGLKGMM